MIPARPSTRTCPTSTPRSIPRSSTPRSATPPTCSTACSTTSPTSASRMHYTDTGGFTDHVFALCHLLGYRFAPRIRDLADKRLAVIEKPSCYPALVGLIGTALNTKQITAHWDEILRLATSIRQDTVTASLM